MSNPIIQVSHLSKSYRLGIIGRKTLQDELYYLWLKLRGHNPLEHMTRIGGNRHSLTNHQGLFQALDDVSFDVEEGEVVGIIGRNGAGKSTLLKILSRITEPTSGEAIIDGRWGSLLEVGTGFHPDLTGRENIYMNGTILGMKKVDIDRKFDEIVAFAEVDQFLDTPVRRYSSGMTVRLAFAVAAHLDTEILIVDEVLAVGDAQFQKKCIGKLGDVARDGRTVLFVSHQMNAIRSFCTRCIWLHHGKVVDQGDPETIISRYMDFNTHETEWHQDPDKPIMVNPNFTPQRLALIDQEGHLLQRDLHADEPLNILIEGVCERPSSALIVGFSLSTSSGDAVFVATHTDGAIDQWPPITPGLNRLTARIPPQLLNEGSYKIELHIVLHNQKWISRPGVNAPGIKFSVRGGLSQSPYWLSARHGSIAPHIKFNILGPEIPL
jgi:lipopolysaccharide transport system ATP-binding protein